MDGSLSLPSNLSLEVLGHDFWVDLKYPVSGPKSEESGSGA